MKTLSLLISIGLFFIEGYNQLLAQSADKSLTMTPALTKSLIDSLDRTLQRYYIFPDKAILMGKHLQSQFRKNLYQKFTNPNELVAKLGDDLQAIHADGHLFIRYDPAFDRALKENNPAQRKADDSLALRDAIDQNFGLNRVEILDGNIGYLPVYSFTPFVDRARRPFFAALNFLSQTRALILDLRYNGGGSPEMVGQLGSYFFPIRTPFTTIENRVRQSTTEYWADPANADSLNLSMPVYILTSHSTFSAAEDFSYSMQQAKRALIVGDATGGGAHPARPFPLGQGFMINLPFAQSINPYSKTNWEGKGVVPDMPVKADSALEKAQDMILTKAMEQALTGKERRKFQWAIHELKARQQQYIPPHESLKSYTGDFNGLIVYSNNNVLFCKNTGRGDQVTQLKPIRADWFTLNEQVHFEFIRNGEGPVSGLKMHWRDGREIPVSKTK